MIRALSLVVVTWAHTVAAEAQITCATADECRRHAREAIAATEYERAHDLAWLAFQKGMNQDPATLTLLARAQSLSGRPDDAFVMLRRLAEVNVVVEDVEESEDFRRVRSHAQWPQLQAMFAAIRSRAVASVVPPEPARLAEPVVKPPPEPPAPPAPAARTAPRAAVTPPPSLVAPTPAAKEDPAATRTPAPTKTPAAPKTPTAITGPVAIAPAAAAAPAITTPTRAADDLMVSAPITQPAALAYDSVSARFVLGTAMTDALTVISQTSSNVTSFTSRGWSGHDATTALAVDRGAGDLWVAVGGTAGASLHRLQLISGRRLEVIALSEEPRAELIALALTGNGILALDRAGRQVYRRAPAAKTLAVHATLPKDLALTGLASSRQALYVAHAEGLIRIDEGSRRQRAVTAPNTHSLGGLQSMAWHDGVLLGVQSIDGRLTVVRLHLNGAGTAVTKVDRLDAAASTAAAMAGGVYYYLASDDVHSRPVVRAIVAK